METPGLLEGLLGHRQLWSARHDCDVGKDARKF